MESLNNENKLYVCIYVYMCIYTAHTYIIYLIKYAQVYVYLCYML